MKKTKIVTTIGPTTETVEDMTNLINSGANVFRFNTKHNVVEWHSGLIGQAEKIAEEMGERIAILVDLQGPEVRVSHVPEKYTEIKEGDELIFGNPSNPDAVGLDHPEIFKDLVVGQIIFLDDGFLEFEVTETADDYAVCKTIQGGTVKERKTSNFPGMHLPFPALIEKDKEYLNLAKEHHVDFFALSFVRTADDINVLRKEMADRGIEGVHVVAKIEHPDAVQNFDEILEVSDAIMVARGDLGVEYPLEEVPALQKSMISQCREAGKPVIVATQMLETMSDNPRPTRAEVSDVANAVYDGTDAVMLSGETSAGKYPIRTVQTMAKIVNKADEFATFPEIFIDLEESGQNGMMVGAAHDLMYAMEDTMPDVKAFVVLTESGSTARLLSRLRPEKPIYALTQSRRTLDQLLLSKNVKGLHYDYSKKSAVDMKDLLRFVGEETELVPGDKVIMLYGETWGQAGGTSVIRIQEIV